MKRTTNTISVVVTTAVAANKKEKEDVEKFASRMVEESAFEIDYRVDPTILGGIRIDVEGKVYDATVATQLKQLTRVLQG